MKKFTTLFIAIVLFAKLSSAQNTFVQTVATSNDEKGFDLVQMSDSGFVVTGSISNGTDEDIYLAKFDKTGALIWQRSYGGGGNQKGLAIAKLAWGGLIISANNSWFGNGDILLIKTDETGGILWAKDFGGSGNDLGKVIEVTAGGNYRITGVMPTSGQNKAGILTVDSNGVFISVNYITNPVSTTDYRAHYLVGNRMGITGADQMLIFTDTIGDYTGQLFKGSDGKSIDACYIPGGYYAIAHWDDYGTSNPDCGVYLTDTAGTKIWNVKLATTDNDIPVWIKPDGHGGILVGLQSRNSGYISKLVLVALDLQGNVKWQNHYNTGGSNDHFLGNFITTMDGGFAFTGAFASSLTFNYNLMLAKADSTGNTGCDVIPFNAVVSPSNEITTDTVSGLNWSLGNVGVIQNPAAVGLSATAIFSCNSITALKRIDKLNVKSWPNPVNNALHLTLDAVSGFTITDIAGRQHLNGTVFQEDIIDITNLINGVYLLHLVSDKASAVVKFIKE